MVWNDQIFRDAVDNAAKKVGKTRTAALLEAGIAKGWLSYDPRGGRQIDMLEKLMTPLGWEPSDVIKVISDAFGWPREDTRPKSPPATCSRNDKGDLIVIEIDRLRLRCGRLEVLIQPAGEINRGDESIARE